MLAGAIPFDLENGPLYRFIVVSVDEDQHLLGASMHHIVTDGAFILSFENKRLLQGGHGMCFGAS